MSLQKLVAIFSERVLEFFEADAVDRLVALLLQLDEFVEDPPPLGRLVFDGGGAPGDPIARKLTEDLAGDLANDGRFVVVVESGIRAYEIRGGGRLLDGGGGRRGGDGTGRRW
jgi:hypothetical protein